MGFTLFTQIINAQVPSYVPSNGLVGYWPFNGNANDASGNGYNGVVNGALLSNDRFGISNNAFSFDGINNKISLPLQQSGITSYSISGWFKTSLGGPLISGRASAGQICLTLHIHNINTGVTNNGKIIYIVDSPSSSIGKMTNNTFIDNNWHHIVGVYNGAAGSVSPNQFSIYIDNILVSQSITNTGSESAPINNGTNLLIGAHQAWPSGNYFQGLMDDIGIWSRALTQAEITGLYTTLGTEQTPANNQITVYPNPTKEQITIDCGTISNTSGWSYKMVNTLGQEVLNGKINSQQNAVSLNSLNGSGVYLVKIYDASNNLLNTQKIILQ